MPAPREPDPRPVRDKLLESLPAIMRAFGPRAAAGDLKTWAEAVTSGDPVPAADAAKVGAELAGRLRDRVAAGKLDDVSRCVGIVTVLAVPGAAAAGEVVSDESGDLLAPLGAAFTRLLTDAPNHQAGPMALYWLARGAAKFEPEFRAHASPAVATYFAALRDPATPVPADRAFAFLRSRRPVHPTRDRITPRRDVPAADRLAGVFNGGPTWTRMGVVRAVACGLVLLAGLVVGGVWWSSDAAAARFRAAQIQPLQSPLLPSEDVR